jgi:hypothetical protein
MNWEGLILLALGVVVVAGIANNQRVNPRLRLIARYIEGDLVQDLETGVFHFIFA